MPKLLSWLVSCLKGSRSRAIQHRLGVKCILNQNLSSLLLLILSIHETILIKSSLLCSEKSVCSGQSGVGLGLGRPILRSIFMKIHRMISSQTLSSRNLPCTVAVVTIKLKRDLNVSYPKMLKEKQIMYLINIQRETSYCSMSILGRQVQRIRFQDSNLILKISYLKNILHPLHSSYFIIEQNSH